MNLKISFFPEPGGVMNPDIFFEPDLGGVITRIIMIHTDLSGFLAVTPTGSSHFDRISTLNKSKGYSI